MLSLGCMGNRLYTRLGEDEMYFVARGMDLEAIAEALEVIVRANVALADYARSRQAQLSTL
jgi:uncharacterized protein (DUF169 family)